MPVAALQVARLLGTALATVLLAVALSPASANASPAGATTAKHCYTIIEKIVPSAPAARVIARGCASTTAAADLARQKAVPNCGCAPLVTFYQNVDYAGYDDTIYGKDGPCDYTGYGLSDLTYENDYVISGISSYQTHNCCWGQKYWNRTSGWNPWTTPCQTWTNTWEVWYVGSACNDRVYSFWVWDNKTPR